MPHYKITAVGAGHRRKEKDANGRLNWRIYGYGDVIELTTEQYNSGRYSHLKLHHVSPAEARASEEAEAGKRQADEEAKQAELDAANLEAGKNTEEQDRINAEKLAEQERIAAEQLNTDPVARLDKLIADVTASGTAAAFNVARAAVEAAKVLDVVPAKKAETLTALQALRDGLTAAKE